MFPAWQSLKGTGARPEALCGMEEASARVANTSGAGVPHSRPTP